MGQSNDQLRVAVVGGGIAGLAAAFRLNQVAPHIHVVLIEQDEQLGGKIKTERFDGFVIETGPDSFLSSKPRGIGLSRELGIDDRLQGVNQATRRTFVMRDGRLYDLPEGLTGLVPTKLRPVFSSRLLSPSGKARMALDYVLPAQRGDGDETLAHFIQRRLGAEVYERLVEPLMAGIYAGDGRQLSLAATFPQLRQGEIAHGGLIKGVLAARRSAGAVSNGAVPRSPFLAPQTGMAEIVESLASRLTAAGTRILTGATAVQLSRTSDDGYRITLDSREVISADTVILATPAGATATLVEQIAPRAASLLAAIPHVSSALVTLAFPEDALSQPFVGHGYVIPRIERRPALACTWVSSKWANRAPEDHVLVRVFLGRAGADDVVSGSDDELISLARDELRMTLAVAAEPEFTRVRRWHNGMPQYTLGHLERVAEIERQVSQVPGLYVAGHAYRGIGIPDCVASGEGAADMAVRSR